MLKRIEYLVQNMCLTNGKENKMTAIEKKQEELIEKYKDALEKIANPIGWMQNDAEKRGLRLDGMWAIKLAEDHNYLREIASKALSELAELKEQRIEAKKNIKKYYNKLNTPEP